MKLKQFILTYCLSMILSYNTTYAQFTVMGSSLASAPNTNFGCEFQPVIANVQGDYALVPSGVADCTWRQSGVFGVLNDTRFSSVPGDGFITSFSVRSGPNPAPLRLSVFRQLGTGGFAGECCFFRSESAPVQPRPNAISSFTVNIPVERNTINGFQAIDLIGISSSSGTGSLPLLVVQTPNNFNLTNTGSVNSGFFYPRIGSLANDSGGGRREDGIPGIELLLSWTWCPARLAGPLGCLASGPGPFSNGGTLQVSNNRIPVAVLCNRNAVCEGVVRLLTGARITNGSNKVLALSKKKSFRVSAGKSKTFSLVLNKRAKNLLKSNSTITANVWINPAQGQGSTHNSTVTVSK